MVYYIKSLSMKMLHAFPIFLNEYYVSAPYHFFIYTSYQFIHPQCVMCKERNCVMNQDHFLDCTFLYYGKNPSIVKLYLAARKQMEFLQTGWALNTTTTTILVPPPTPQLPHYHQLSHLNNTTWRGSIKNLFKNTQNCQFLIQNSFPVLLSTSQFANV